MKRRTVSAQAPNAKAKPKQAQKVSEKLFRREPMNPRGKALQVMAAGKDPNGTGRPRDGADAKRGARDGGSIMWSPRSPAPADKPPARADAGRTAISHRQFRSLQGLATHLIEEA